VTANLPGPPEFLPACPDAIVDLQTLEGAALVGGQWRYCDTQVRETSFVAVGPDLGPSGPANRTYEVVPHAQAADLDDTAQVVGQILFGEVNFFGGDSILGGRQLHGSAAGHAR